jgi:hypothetical protein
MKQHPSGKTMSMIGFSKYGKPSQLKKTNVAYPHGFDASNNIVIKVHASAINPVDKAHISGDLKLVRPIESFPTSFVTMLQALLRKQTLRENSLLVNPYLPAFLETKVMERKHHGTEGQWRSTVLQIQPMWS